MNTKQAVAEYKRLNAEREAALPKIVAAVVKAHEGGASEVQLAETFGASRMTIRRCLGK